ncbi:MAG TPA: SPOR domain-containing protein [Burkholderiaceae bacterium]|jgi:hypothetical protein|nr:SPOR domain-containing protein [Burkholderiaceae bacterium]
MLRALVAVLLLANALLFAWAQGWLDGVAGVKPQGDREPERLARQVKPQSVRVLSPAVVQTALAASAAEAAPAEATAASAALSCLEAGPFVGAAEQRAAADEIKRAALPPGAIASAAVTRPAVFIVYMGKYASPEALQRKTDELKRRNVESEVLHNVPWLEPGLALGRFNDRAAAEAHLAALAERDVHTAKVLTLAPPATGHVWRAERADTALAAKLTALKAKALGSGFAPCGSAETATR